MTYWVWILRSK